MCRLGVGVVGVVVLLHKLGRLMGRFSCNGGGTLVVGVGLGQQLVLVVQGVREVLEVH